MNFRSEFKKSPMNRKHAALDYDKIITSLFQECDNCLAKFFYVYRVIYDLKEIHL